MCPQLSPPYSFPLGMLVPSSSTVYMSTRIFQKRRKSSGPALASRKRCFQYTIPLLPTPPRRPREHTSALSFCAHSLSPSREPPDAAGWAGCRWVVWERVGFLQLRLQLHLSVWLGGRTRLRNFDFSPCLQRFSISSSNPASIQYPSEI